MMMQAVKPLQPPISAWLEAELSPLQQRRKPDLTLLAPVAAQHLTRPVCKDTTAPSRRSRSLSAPGTLGLDDLGWVPFATAAPVICHTYM